MMWFGELQYRFFELAGPCFLGEKEEMVQMMFRGVRSR